MRCPALNDLPSPVVEKPDWPWIIESKHVSNDFSWPKISIVTPSYNQGQFIEETIRSVLLQGYPNLEYIVIDGGSTDGSVEIIQKYEPWLKSWVSEPDNGQTNAINKGWRQSAGEYVTWLNSDDLLLPGSLQKSVTVLIKDETLDIVYGNVLKINEYSKPLPKPYDRIVAKSFDLYQMLVKWRNPVPQQGFLMRRSLLERIGYLDESFDFTMDFEYWVRIALNGYRGKPISHFLGVFRQHQVAKSSTIQRERIQDRYHIHSKVFEEDSIPDELVGLSDRSKQNLSWNAAYIAYRAGDARSARLYASKYMRSGGLRYFPRVLLLFLLSLLGSRGLEVVHGLIRRIRVRFNLKRQNTV